MWSGELRPGEEVIVDLGATGAWLMEARPAGAAEGAGRQERRASLGPVAYAADGGLLVGAPARGRLAVAPSSGVSEWLERIGDDVPVVLGGRTIAAEDLLAQVIRSHVGDAVSALRLVVPATWGPHRQAVVQDALRRVGLASVRLVPGPLATVHAPGLVLPGTGRVLVVDAGDRRTSAALVDLAPEGPRLARVAVADLGGGDIDEALLEFVRVRLAGPVDDGEALVRACRNARESLSLAPAAELQPPGGEPLRLVRAELDALVGERLRSTLAALLERLGNLPFEAVVLAGGLARMPLLVETLSDLVDSPVQVPSDPALAAVRGAAHVVPGRPWESPQSVTVPAVARGADEAAESGSGMRSGQPLAQAVTEVESATTDGESAPGTDTDAVPPGRLGLLVPLRRYGGLASAAATVVVVLSAPLAFPELNLALSPGQSDGRTAGAVIAESRSAADRASNDGGAPAASRPGPLRVVADLLTPGLAAAHERVPGQDAAKESPGPLRALADRIAAATPSGRPSAPPAGAERSTNPATAKSSGSRSVPASTQAADKAASPTQVGGDASALSDQTGQEAQPTQAASQPDPPATTAPPTQTTGPAPQPTTAPPTTAPPTTQAPAPQPDPTTQAPAPQPDPTTAPPAPQPAPTTQAPAPDPAPTSADTSSVPDPAPTGETLDAGAV